MKHFNNSNRFRIGIIFDFSPVWMGGIVYILNIIKTLDYLDDIEKPQIFLFYRTELREFLNEINYPYFKAIEWPFPPIVKGIVYSWIIKKNIFIAKILKDYSLNAIFPVNDFPVRTKTNVKLVSWWADLQEKHYPEFFSKMQFLGRDLRARLILRNCDYLIVSSQAVLDDFARFFKLRKGLNIHIFHFVSVIDNLENVRNDDLRTKYNLPEKYFLVSNQFHKHKNHKVLLLSIVKLKEKGIRRHLAITGKFPDSSDSPYMSELHEIISENNLQDQITILGVIPRNDQLQIMRHAQAVLQPSLFEGWSTVIEDAKSLQVPVVASNLNVNIEQLGENGIYFDPYNPDELATILVNFPERNLEDTFYEDYTIRIRKAAKELLGILSGLSINHI